MKEIAPGKAPSTELVFSHKHAGGRDGFSEIFVYSQPRVRVGPRMN